MKIKCEDLRCIHKLTKDSCFLHNAKMYYREYYKKTGEEFYWACDSCITEDHKKWNEQHRPKYQLNELK